MIIKLYNLNFMNSWDLWAPRNTKALKSSAAAIEGIVSHAQRSLLGGNWIELSLKDRYLRKGYYVGVANRSGC